MTEMTAKLDFNSFLTRKAPEEKSWMDRAPMKAGGLVLLVLAIAAYMMATYAIDARKKDLLAEAQKRLEISASGKANVVETWLDTTAQRANRIAGNELFQLFATEINQASGDKLPEPLAAQLPYMQNAFTNFAIQDKLIGAYLIGRDGRAYLASGDAPQLTEEQRVAARAEYDKNALSYLPVRATESGLALDFLIPIRAAQSAVSGQGTKVVGVLLVSLPATEPFSRFLAPARFSAEPISSRLFQKTDGALFELTPTRPPYLAGRKDAELSAANLEFQKVTFPGDLVRYAGGTDIPGTDLVLFQQIDEADALKGLQTYSLIVGGLAVSAILVIFAVLATIWLTLKGQNARALARQYREFAGQINVQRRLLGSINNSIDELIGLTDPEGTYIYANPSLARMTNFPVRSIPGKTDRDLFGEEVARQLAEFDRKAIATEQTVNAFVEVNSLDGPRTLRVAKSRFLNEDGAFLGIVTVSSDITEYVEHQRRKDEIAKKSINVLVRMLEANDPYLAGHSDRLSKLADHVATQMALPEETHRIINAGAHLSQIGKISIPRNIRVKESRLTEEEQAVMQKHVLVAQQLLVEAEIGGDVIDAVTQINERLDGSGYPNGLDASEIGVPARILGMADVLIARISPRSYREAITIDEALNVFRSNPEKYDQEIVAAMTAFFESDIGAEFRQTVTETADN